MTALFANAYAGILAFVGNQIQSAIETPNGNTGWVIWTAVTIVGLSAGRALSLYLMTIFNNTGVQRGLVDIQAAQFDHLTDGDYERLAEQAAGGLVSRFINDVNAIRDAALRFANNFTKSIVTVLGAFGIMLWLDWKLTLILLVAYPIAFGPVIALGNRVRKRAKTAQNQIGEVTSLLNEGFQSARMVKAYGLESYQKSRAKTGFIERSRLFLKVLTDKAAVDPILEVTGGVALAGILGFSAWQIASGGSSLGDLLGIIAAIGIAAPELRALGTLNAVAQEGAGAADRVFDVLDRAGSNEDQAGAHAIANVKGAIEFKNVHFGYSDGTAVLNGLTFAVKPGERLAIVGPSGAGKSTLFNLLLRLYPVGSGEVTLDGHNIDRVTADSLRREIALVSQDTSLFDDTIENNILLGDLSADKAAVRDAAKLANADEFIGSLSEGYLTMAGEFGRNLSGGQRQRVALARAMLRSAPVLLLDEATSALDAESEAVIQQSLDSFMQGRTSIIIAHRLATVRSADRILVMEDGQIVESGTHDSLMRDGGLYKRLADLQLS
ncbi:MAG: ABC transporter ATP-binding protein [Pseudomonadota bacterium]